MYKVLEDYKKSAVKRGYEYNVSLETFKTLTKSPCIYCGKPPSKVDSTKCSDKFIYTGIDRMNNDLGYEDDNCVPCCTMCNYGKHNRSHDEYQAHLEQVALHVCKQKPHLVVSIERFNYCNAPF